MLHWPRGRQRSMTPLAAPIGSRLLTKTSQAVVLLLPHRVLSTPEPRTTLTATRTPALSRCAFLTRHVEFDRRWSVRVRAFRPVLKNGSGLRVNPDFLRAVLRRNIEGITQSATSGFLFQLFIGDLSGMCLQRSGTRLLRLIFASLANS